MFNKKCVVEYDGTYFVGWQVQNNGRTVQEEIEKGLSRIYKHKIRIIGSGRTDTGVHALNQVFCFRSEKYLDSNALFKGLNSVLPDDMVIKSVEDVPLEFHAQRSALHKTYLYKILNREYPSALDRKRYWWVRYPLDVERLQLLTVPFVGELDFSAMCVKRSLKENNIRKLNFIRVERVGDVVQFEVDADGFLHNMVRNIVGTIKDFYFNNRTAEDIVDVLNSKDRDLGGVTAPPHGLYLKDVYYE